MSKSLLCKGLQDLARGVHESLEAVFVYTTVVGKAPNLSTVGELNSEIEKARNRAQKLNFPDLLNSVTQQFAAPLQLDAELRSLLYLEMICSLHTAMFDGSVGVPGKMKWQEQSIIVVYEARIDVVPHVGRLAAKLRAQTGNLHRIARLGLPLIGHLVGLGFPGPRSGDIESQGLCVEGVTDRFDVPTDSSP